MAHVTTKVMNGQIVYFSEAPDQRHLAKMIRKQRSSTKIFRRSQSRRNLNLSNLSESQENSALVTPKSWTNALVFRRKQSSRKSAYQFDHSIADNSITDHSFKRPKSPCDSFIRPPPPQAPKISEPFSTPSYLESSSKRLRLDEREQDYNNNNNTSSYSSMNSSLITGRFFDMRDDGVS